MNTGRCMCGKVHFEVNGALRPIISCHCVECRRMTGHYLPATAAMREDFTLYGAEHLSWYAASPKARRGFCAHCGSSLFWDCYGAAHISISAGALASTKGLAVLRHIFVEEKGDYYSLKDDVPQIIGDDMSMEIE